VKIRYRAEARAELLAAVEWYEDRRRTLGEDFLAEIKRAEAVIAERPSIWPRWPGAAGDIRRFMLVRFPYSLAYRQFGDDIAVIAVAHQHRAPFYWRDRVR
jgi:hypothetical protein